MSKIENIFPDMFSLFVFFQILRVVLHQPRFPTRLSSEWPKKPNIWKKTHGQRSQTYGKKGQPWNLVSGTGLKKTVKKHQVMFPKLFTFFFWTKTSHVGNTPCSTPGSPTQNWLAKGFHCFLAWFFVIHLHLHYNCMLFCVVFFIFFAFRDATKQFAQHDGVIPRQHAGALKAALALA